MVQLVQLGPRCQAALGGVGSPLAHSTLSSLLPLQSSCHYCSSELPFAASPYPIGHFCTLQNGGGVTSLGRGQQQQLMQSQHYGGELVSMAMLLQFGDGAGAGQAPASAGPLFSHLFFFSFKLKVQS